mgnify:CR=1 FL=1
MTALVQSSVTTGAPTRPAAERALRGLVSDPVHLAGRGVRALLRQPWFVAITLVQPVVWLLLFGALFENVVPAPNGDWGREPDGGRCGTGGGKLGDGAGGASGPGRPRRPAVGAR